MHGDSKMTVHLVSQHFESSKIVVEITYTVDDAIGGMLVQNFCIYHLLNFSYQQKHRLYFFTNLQE